MFTQSFMNQLQTVHSPRDYTEVWKSRHFIRMGSTRMETDDTESTTHIFNADKSGFFCVFKDRIKLSRSQM